MRPRKGDDRPASTPHRGPLAVTTGRRNARPVAYSRGLSGPSRRHAMALHFTRDEYAARLAATRERMAERSLDALLVLRPQSLYWLCGYDGEDFVRFQALLVGAEGDLVLLTDRAGRAQAGFSSIVEHIHLCADTNDSHPGEDLRRALNEHGFADATLGIEWDSACVPVSRGQRIAQALHDDAELVDASDLVATLRLVKSDAELAYLRRAGELAQATLGVALRESRPGAFLAEVRAAMLAECLRGDGDLPAQAGRMGAGAGALLTRARAGHDRIGATDLVVHEFATAYRRYHAALAMTLVTGSVDARQQRLFDACREALTTAETALRAGNTLGAVHEAQRRVLVGAGVDQYRVADGGCSMGVAFPPTWQEEPLVRHAEPLVLAPRMVFFVRVLLGDHENGLAASLGEQVVITTGTCERITRAPRELVNH